MAQTNEIAPKILAVINKLRTRNGNRLTVKFLRPIEDDLQDIRLEISELELLTNKSGLFKFFKK